ncbi:MAG TPA: glycosyltransferase family 39 protein [Candidatus Binataceae bacterium]|nr:glycosyltransferase family 39 protein [Candidatus Binataceae bacterium]
MALKRAGWLACGGVALWYLFAWAMLRPLADAPVADSWLYGEAVRRYLQTGEVRFAGYTQAMPIAQVYYGAAWARLFGGGSASLEIADVVLAALGAMMFYALARRCGATPIPSLIATGCLLGNPCYNFLSFSFMTEIPFLMLVIAVNLAFAEGEGRFEALWMWLAAILSVVCFMIRPFAAMTVLGCVAAIVLYGSGVLREHPFDLMRMVRGLFPFAVASATCVGIWFWQMVLNPRPWDLERNLNHFGFLFQVPISTYLRAGVLGPLIYLGTVLSPIALLQFIGERRRQTIAWAIAIFGSTLFLSFIDHRLPVTPEYSCFGGWDNVMILRGLPNRFYWNGDWQYFWMALGSAGAAGLIVAARDLIPRLGRAPSAIMIAAIVYWLAIVPLWFFNDRYYVVMVPAGCLLLALTPWPKLRVAPMLAGALTLILMMLSLGGTYAYQRGLLAVTSVRDALEREGVRRSAIDAGYSLNGNDLYRYPKHGIDSMKLEAGIPMITSPGVDEYTLASAPIAGTQIVSRFSWPGPFGLGSRELYVLKKAHAYQAGAAPAKTQPRF